MSITLQQIADRAGVSRGTVDRVIHKRGKVNPDKEKLVLSVAKEMGYVTNPHARALVMRKKKIKIGMIFQFTDAAFIKLVVESAKKAQFDFKVHDVEVEIKEIKGTDENLIIEYIDYFIENNFSGFVILPIKTDRVCAKINEAMSKGLKVISTNCDLKEIPFLTYLGIDNYKAGKACAGLMELSLQNKGKIIIVSRDTYNLSQNDRISGFKEVIECTNIDVVVIIECNDDSEIAYELVTNYLENHEDITGIYVTGGGHKGVCRAAKERDLCIICFDLIEDTISELKKGRIDFIIAQNSYKQGYLAALLLKDHLLLDTELERVYDDEVSIKTKYNL